ncbi:MAG: hypothetical protein ACYDH1_15935 [Anaerolineaceae bacterium]
MNKRKPLFKREQLIKLQRLLDMLYKPSEIADEIGVSKDTVYRSYLPAGAPHERDKLGSIWIHGPSFREWVLNQVGARQRTKHELQLNEAWCLTCNKPVAIQNQKERPVNRYLNLIYGYCPDCKTKVNRMAGKIQNLELKPNQKDRRDKKAN